MAFVRVKRKGNRIYYYLVESKREGNKVRQRVIRYLGTEQPTKRQIEAILKEVKDESKPSKKRQKRSKS